MHAAHKENPYADEQKHREPGNEERRQEGRLFFGLAVYLNARLSKIVDHPNVAGGGNDIFRTALRRHGNAAALNVHALDLAFLGIIHELGVARRIGGLLGHRIKLTEDGKENDRDENPYGNAGE